MNRTLVIVSLLAAPCVAQTAAFEVVSIKHFPDFRKAQRTGLANNSGRMKGNITIFALLLNAFGVSNRRITAPDWATLEVYDFEAIVPADATK